ncbi:MAG TPA: TIR domain-containing protein [Opitutaceae bacterium]|nr:TIR domain-containing protein [Opitutaceae bacterium]
MSDATTSSAQAKPLGAVFLSYASQDTEAARKLCQTLRQAGLEVWFDQNELHGGDAWDAKIRRQIKECSLFVPIISTNTESRPEGYFRREWRLAVERTLDMAEDLPFLLPVVIDDTNDTQARVPEKFREVQWTRLAGGEGGVPFAGLIKTILIGESASRRNPLLATRPAAKSQEKSRRVLIFIGGVIVVALLASNAWLWMHRGGKRARVTDIPPSEAQVSKPVTPEKKNTESKTAATEATAAEPPKVIDKKSIAVLPFENLSGDKDNEYFTDGIHEDVITNLAKIGELKVISRTSVMTYKTGDRNLRQIAADLGVANVLEGSVRRAGSKVRVTVQLIDAGTDQHLWAETYDRDATDIFAIQSAIAKEIAGKLAASLSPDEKKVITQTPTTNQKAYDLFLQARSYMARLGWTQSDGQSATHLLEEAVKLDPDFTLGHAWLSVAYSRNLWFGYDQTADAVSRIKQEVDTAARLQPDQPEVHYAWANFYFHAQRNYVGALKELELATKAQPGNADFITDRADVLRHLGRWELATNVLSQARKSDPRNPEILFMLADTLHIMRRYGDAELILERFGKLSPDYRDAGFLRARTLYLHTGDVATQAEMIKGTMLMKLTSEGWCAIEEFVMNYAVATHHYSEMADYLQKFPGATVSSKQIMYPRALLIGWLRHFAGDDGAARAALTDARSWLERALQRRAKNGALHGKLALALAGLGEKEAALQEARLALELAPENKDVIAGRELANEMAIVFAQTGAPDKALAQLEHLMQIPATLSVQSLRNEGWWDPLRREDRFQKLITPVADVKPF